MQVLFNDLNFSKTAIPDARTIDTKNFCCKNKLVNVGGKKRKKKERRGGWGELYCTALKLSLICEYSPLAVSHTVTLIQRRYMMRLSIKTRRKLACKTVIEINLFVESAV